MIEYAEMDESDKIVIPVEIKRRELTGKLLLALSLVECDYTVYIGSMDIHSAIDKIKPDIYFEVSAVNREGRRTRLRKLKECGVSTLILDTEGSAFGDIENFEPRVSKEILSHTDYYCAWGTRSAAIAQKQNPNSETSIQVTGNPRFDLLQKPYRQVYRSEAEEIKNSYGDFILFNTNFSINHVDVEHNMNSALTNMMNKYRKQSRLLGDFISAIGTIAERLEDHNVVVRPHPSEDLAVYKKLLMPFENVYIKKEGEVRPWILASDAVIHNSCTTGVAAALLNTPVFAYLPQDLQLSSIPNDVSKKCYSISELVEDVTQVLNSDTEYSMDDNQISELEPYIGNIDYLSVNKITGIIQNINCGQSTRFNKKFSPSLKHMAKRAILKTIGSERFGPIYFDRLRGGGSVSYKFSKTDVDEIQMIISSFPDSVIPNDLEIDSLSNVVYGFKLQ